MLPKRSIRALLALALCDLPFWTAQGQTPDRADPIVLSVTYVDKHLFTRLDAPGFGALDFLVDTGAEQTAVFHDSLRADSAQSSIKRHVTTVNGYGDGARQRSTKRVSTSLWVGKRLVFAGDAIVLDRGEFARRLSHHVDGILGWDFFEKWCVHFDYGRLQVSLFDRISCAPSSQSFVLSNALSERGAFIPITLSFSKGNPIPAHVRIDTGADDAITLGPRFCGLAGLDKRTTSDETIDGVGINGRYTADRVTAREVTLGDGTVQLENTTIHFLCSELKRNWKKAPKHAAVDGGIGNAVLEQMLITLDPEKQSIYLEPNPAFNQSSP